MDTIMANAPPTLEKVNLCPPANPIVKTNSPDKKEKTKIKKNIVFRFI